MYIILRGSDVLYLQAQLDAAKKEAEGRRKKDEETEKREAEEREKEMKTDGVFLQDAHASAAVLRCIIKHALRNANDGLLHAVLRLDHCVDGRVRKMKKKKKNRCTVPGFSITKI